MQHLDEGTLHALLDGELVGDESRAAYDHLASCPECHGRLAEARELAAEALGLIEELDGIPESTVDDLQGTVTEIPLFSGRFSPAPARSPASRPPQVDSTTPAEDVPVFTPARPAGAPVTPDQAAAATAIPGKAAAPRKQAPRWRWLAPVGLAAAAVLAVVLRPRTTDSGVSGEPKQVIAAAPEQTRTAAPAPVPDSTAAATPRSRAIAPASPRTRPAVAPAVDSGPRPAAPPAPSTANVVASAEAATRATGAASSAAKPADTVLERRQLADQPLKLDELVITQKDAKSLTGRTGAAAKVARGELTAPQAITADQAIKLLGGSIRLVEGLVPVRYEQEGTAVRVVYETTWGPLFLNQWRGGAGLTHRLLAFPGTPKDSVTAWSERIR